MKHKTHKYLSLRNSHLLVSLLIIVPAALTYGLFPAYALPRLFNFEIDTVNLTNVFRAIMGLYLGISIVWFLGIIKPNYWKMATILNIVFMAGLAFGRILSLVIDGLPSTPFVLFLLGEFVLAVFGVFQLKKNY